MKEKQKEQLVGFHIKELEAKVRSIVNDSNCQVVRLIIEATNSDRVIITETLGYNLIDDTFQPVKDPVLKKEDRNPLTG